MSVRRLLLPPVIALLLAGCSDTIGVHDGVHQRASGPQLLRWAGGGEPQFSAMGALRARGTGIDGVALGDTPNELSLEENTASFWAVHGQERSVQINYLSSITGTHAPFLRLVTGDPAYVPGRGELAVGDSVLVTISVDPGTLKVSFEPTGLRFGTPAALEMSYAGAGGDLNGDGRVDGLDTDIESRLLGIWYRETSLDPWTRMPATQSIESKTFSAWLQHFSDYAVSWLEEPAAETEEQLQSDYTVSW